MTTSDHYMGMMGKWNDENASGTRFKAMKYHKGRLASITVVRVPAGCKANSTFS